MTPTVFVEWRRAAEKCHENESDSSASTYASDMNRGQRIDRLWLDIPSQSMRVRRRESMDERLLLLTHSYPRSSEWIRSWFYLSEEFEVCLSEEHIILLRLIFDLDEYSREYIPCQAPLKSTLNDHYDANRRGALRY